MNKSKIIPTIKKWLLMISMSLGIGGYFLILALDLGHETNHQIATVVTNMLPYLLFVMLFLEFSKIEPRDLFPKKWLWMVFAFQIVMAFVTIAIQHPKVWVHATMDNGHVERLACQYAQPNSNSRCRHVVEIGGKGSKRYYIRRIIFTIGGLCHPVDIPIGLSPSCRLVILDALHENLRKGIPCHHPPPDYITLAQKVGTKGA